MTTDATPPPPLATGCAGRGAYGLRLPDLARSVRLGPAPAGWPAWRLETVVDPAVDVGGSTTSVGDERAVAVHDPSGVAVLDRAARRTTLTLRSQPTLEALVHPLLGSTAIIANQWAGRLVFHAGAFLAGGRAWAIVGDRGDGKSSTLAALAAEGLPVLSDDLVVVDGDVVLCGPRCVDLRREPAGRLGMGEALGVVGNRERWRVALPPAPAAAPLAGWIRLRWAPEPTTAWLPFSERLQVVLRSRGLLAATGLEAEWLRVAARPCLSLARPPAWESMAGTVRSILDAVSSA